MLHTEAELSNEEIVLAINILFNALTTMSNALSKCTFYRITDTIVFLAL